MPTYWTTHFDLTELPEFEAKAVDVDQAGQDRTREAHRFLLQSRKNIEIANTNIAISATRLCRTSMRRSATA